MLTFSVSFAGLYAEVWNMEDPSVWHQQTQTATVIPDSQPLMSCPTPHEMDDLGLEKKKTMVSVGIFP